MLKKAAVCYYEVKFLYDLLDKTDKEKLFGEVIALSDEVHYRHIENLLDKGIIELASQNNDKALSIYEGIQSEFEKLSDEYKDKIYPRCCELALHLQNRTTER